MDTENETPAVAQGTPTVEQVKAPPKKRKRPVETILGTTVMLEDFLAEADDATV